MPGQAGVERAAGGPGESAASAGASGTGASGIGAEARIEVSVADAVATVRLHNPAQRNALTRSMCQELARAAAELDARDDVDVVVLCGSGPTFCAGVAINALREVILDAGTGTEAGAGATGAGAGGGAAGAGAAGVGATGAGTVDHLTAADTALTRIAKPTIAVVQGHCMGGGWQLASACDFIVASSDAKFGITPSKLGIIYPRAGVDRLVQLVGPARAKYILMTARTFGADEAQRIGLVAEVLPEAGFDERVDRMLDGLLARSRYSIHTMKRLIDLGTTSDAELDPMWDQAWEEMAAGTDIEIGVEAFLRGTEPRFSWHPQHHGTVDRTSGQ